MLEIFQYSFMIRALLAGIAIAVIAPLIGQFLVVRRYALMADTLAHVSLVGVALGILLKTQPVITALITTVLASLAIERLRTAKKIFGESVLALFLSGSLAIAVVIIGFAKGFNADIFGFLFGSIATVSQNDLIITMILALIIMITFGIFYKPLLLISFDEDLAKVDGIKTKTFNLILVMTTAVTVSLAMRVVGILLIGALMVIPVITAMQFGRGFATTLTLAVTLSLLATITGLFVSYYFDLASGGTIVILTLLMFGISLILNKNT